MEVQREGFKVHIPREEMKPRRLYLLQSRNLEFGIWNGKEGKFKGGFIGIRYKFGQARLDTEYHFEDGAPYGTARPVVDTGLDLPEGIDLKESRPTVDWETGRQLVFDEKTRRTVNIEGKPPRTLPGAWRFKDTGEVAEDVRAVSFENEELFGWLKEYEAGAAEDVFVRQMSGPEIGTHYCVPGFPANECPVCLVQNTIDTKGPGKYWIKVQVRRIE